MKNPLLWLLSWAKPTSPTEATPSTTVADVFELERRQCAGFEYTVPLVLAYSGRDVRRRRERSGESGAQKPPVHGGALRRDGSGAAKTASHVKADDIVSVEDIIQADPEMHANLAKALFRSSAIPPDLDSGMNEVLRDRVELCQRPFMAEVVAMLDFESKL